MNISSMAGISLETETLFDSLLLAAPLVAGIIAVVRASSGSRKPSKSRSTTTPAKAAAERSERILESIATNFPAGLVLALDRKFKFLFIGVREVSNLKKSIKYWLGRGITENSH